MNFIKFWCCRSIKFSLLFLALPLLFFVCLSNPQKLALRHIAIVIDGKTQEVSLEEAMRHYKVPAIGISVINKNKVAWSRSVGYLSASHHVKVDNSTLFQAGSISKSVTAILALILVEKGMLQLDQDVNLVLKGWKIKSSDLFQGTPVTLRQLASMSSGLDTGGYYGYAPEEKLPTLLQILEGQTPANNRPLKLVRKPGSKYDYSGGGYEVMELLINSVTNSTLPAIAQKNLFIPLSMSHSYFAQPLPENLKDQAAQATDDQGNSFLFPWRVNPELAAAGLWTTPTDLAKFVLAVIQSYQGESHSIISSNLAKQALSQQKSSEYGLGFAIAGSGKELHFMKLGQNAGFQSWLIGYPETGQGAVMMTNSNNGRELAQAVAYALAKAYQWPTEGMLKDAWMLGNESH
jgi:CubicO group peptidase (beta-lactamase class C family)